MFGFFFPPVRSLCRRPCPLLLSATSQRLSASVASSQKPPPLFLRVPFLSSQWSPGGASTPDHPRLGLVSALKRRTQPFVALLSHPRVLLQTFGTRKALCPGARGCLTSPPCGTSLPDLPWAERHPASRSPQDLLLPPRHPASCVECFAPAPVMTPKAQDPPGCVCSSHRCTSKTGRHPAQSRSLPKLFPLREQKGA